MSNPKARYSPHLVACSLRSFVRQDESSVGERDLAGPKPAITCATLSPKKNGLSRLFPQILNSASCIQDNSAEVPVHSSFNNDPLQISLGKLATGVSNTGDNSVAPSTVPRSSENGDAEDSRKNFASWREEAKAALKAETRARVKAEAVARVSSERSAQLDEGKIYFRFFTPQISSHQ